MKKMINHSLISAYAGDFAKKVCTSFFAQNPRVSGSQLKSLSPSTQINMLLIKLLFLRWQSETAKLQSPFFDFEAAEVKTALKGFMDTLSKNISVGPEAAEKLLAEATEETLFLITDISAFFERMFGTGSSCNPGERADEAAKYVRLRKPIYEEIRTLLQQKHPAECSPAEALATVKSVSEKHDFSRDAETLLADLKNYLPLNTADLWLVEAPAEEKIPDSPTIFGTEDFDFEPDFTATDEFVSDKIVPAVEPSVLKEDDFIELTYPLTNVPKKEVPARTSFRDKLSLEQKFTFTNELFKGDVKEFEEALVKIDEAADYHDAIMVIKNNYFRKHGWNLQSEPVKSFYETLSLCF